MPCVKDFVRWARLRGCQDKDNEHGYLVLFTWRTGQLKCVPIGPLDDREEELEEPMLSHSCDVLGLNMSDFLSWFAADAESIPDPAAG